MIAAVIVLGVTAVTTSLAFCWAAWDRAERAAEADAILEALGIAEGKLLRARLDARADAMEADERIDRLTGRLESNAAERLELRCADRILPDLRDPDELAAFDSHGPAPIYEALQAERRPWIVFPVATLAEAVR